MKDLWNLLTETFREWNEDRVPRLAAALAYYTVFSLAPFLVVVIAIVGLVFGRDAVQGRLVQQIQGLVGTDGATIIQELIQTAYQPSTGVVATVIGIATVLLGAGGVFLQLQDALNAIWGVKPRPKVSGILLFLRARMLSFALLVSAGFLLLVSLVISAGIAALDHFLNGILPGWQVILQVINFMFSWGIVTLLFAMIYKYLPDIRIAWRDVWVGAFLTALLFNVGKQLLGLYLGNSGIASAYGAAGSLVIVLVWVYYSAQILLLGAEFTQVYARRYGSHVRSDGVPDESRTSTHENKAIPEKA